MRLLCEYCRDVFPSTETTVVTDQVLSGESTSSRLYKGTRGGLGFGGTSRVSYRFKERAICLNCAEKRARRFRKAETVRRVKRIAGSITLIALVGYCVARSENIPTHIPETDVEWLTVHGNDPKALSDKFGNQADAECSSKADDYLRSIAKHEFKWNGDAQGFLAYKFDKFSLRSLGDGLLTEISSKAELSNGFGAFDSIQFYCVYNVKTDKVVRYSLSDPGLDLIPTPALQDKSDLPATSVDNEANESSGAPTPDPTESVQPPAPTSQPDSQDDLPPPEEPPPPND